MQSFSIRPASPEQLPEILQIYASARQFMKENGNPNQWKDHFPPENMLAEDIRNGQLYVIENDSGIHGVFAFILGEDPTYQEIYEGNWLSDTPYGTIHKVASDGSVHGLVDKITGFCSQTISHLRIDTHEDNKVMQHVITKNGFQKCGMIRLADGSMRIAYERL